MPKKYFRAIHLSPGEPCNCGMLTPYKTDVEKVEKINGYQLKYWMPEVNEPPIFSRSTEKVLCFSESPGGAVLGATTGEYEFAGGRMCVCETTEKPDIDLSDEMVGDFEIVREVRYRKPVETDVTGPFTVNEKLLNRTTDAYQWTPDREGFVKEVMADGYTRDYAEGIYEQFWEDKSIMNKEELATIRDEINRDFGWREG